MKDVLERIFARRIVPVAVVHDAAHAVPLAEALVRGGLPCMEVTLRTEAAMEVIRKTAGRGDLVVGAGTVLSVDQAKEAVDAGATFIVAPGFNPALVRYCLDQGLPVVPGVCTPTEIEAALGFGLDVLKFFPAEAMGGLKTLKAIGGPYGKVRFMPTGGIGLGNLADYLAYNRVAACGGSWMASSKLLAAGDFEAVERLTAEAVKLANSLKG